MVAACCFGVALGCADGTAGWILVENEPIGAIGADSGTNPAADGGVPFEAGVTPPGRFPRNPDDFAGVCSPELSVQNRTNDNNWRLFRDAFPDLPEFVLATTKRCCALLYKMPSEVPRTRHLSLVIEDFQGAGYMQDSGDQTTIQLSADYMRYVANYGGSVRAEMAGILYYLVAIDYSFKNEDPNYTRWLTQGIGEWARHQAGQGALDKRRPGGTWTDGYETTGYFLDWLTEQYPDAVYRLNKSLDQRDGVYWDERVFEYITGQPLPGLWNAYQASF
jgi:hypothetical protein